MAEFDLTGFAAAAACAESSVCVVQGEPPVRLSMFSVNDGRFCVGKGLDGLVITDRGAAIHEMAMFSDPGRARLTRVEHDLPEHGDVLDDVFIGFDAAWTNWFHWLCFALARSALAADLLPPSCRIVLPDIAEPGLRGETRRQSLAAAGLADRVTFLSPGIYRARRIRFLWTDLPRPTDLTRMRAFHAVFAKMRRGLRRRPELPGRLLVARDRDPNPRLDTAETTLLHRMADAHGFTPAYFAEMDFNAQAEAMFNADAVVGMHGAGLANVLFGRTDLRLLELNRIIGPETAPRPWFRMLCAGRGQRHHMLHAEPGKLTVGTLDAALATLCDGLPAPRRQPAAEPVLLATICNTTPNARPVALWLARGDTQSVIDLADVLDQPGDVGLTGLAWHDGRLYCAVQTSAHPRIVVLDRRLVPVTVIADANFADLHSLTVAHDGLLIASTGNGRVLRYGFADGRIDTLCELGGDLHLNSACRDGDDLLVCCQNLAPLDPVAQHGGIYSVAERRVLLDDLGYPHSVMRVGDGFVVLDSGRGRVLRCNRDGIQRQHHIGGFLRGAAVHGDALLVASGPERLVSRSTGEVRDGRSLRQSLAERITLHTLDAATLTPRASRPVVAAGFELYEVVAPPADAGVDPIEERVLPADQTAFARLFYNAFMALQARPRR